MVQEREVAAAMTLLHGRMWNSWHTRLAESKEHETITNTP